MKTRQKKSWVDSGSGSLPGWKSVAGLGTFFTDDDSVSTPKSSCGAELPNLNLTRVISSL